MFAQHLYLLLFIYMEINSRLFHSCVLASLSKIPPKFFATTPPTAYHLDWDIYWGKHWCVLILHPVPHWYYYLKLLSTIGYSVRALAQFQGPPFCELFFSYTICVSLKTSNRPFTRTNNCPLWCVWVPDGSLRQGECVVEECVVPVGRSCGGVASSWEPLHQPTAADKSGQCTGRGPHPERERDTHRERTRRLRRGEWLRGRLKPVLRFPE
jgi:hypothetical protein